MKKRLIISLKVNNWIVIKRFAKKKNYRFTIDRFLNGYLRMKIIFINATKHDDDKKKKIK